MTSDNKATWVQPFSVLETHGAKLVLRVSDAGKVDIWSPMPPSAIKALFVRLAAEDYPEPEG